MAFTYLVILAASIMVASCSFLPEQQANVQPLAGARQRRDTSWVMEAAARLFDDLDSNGDGELTVGEMQASFRRRDTDGTPGVSLAENQAYMQNLNAAAGRNFVLPANARRALFRSADRDNNGVLDDNDVATMFTGFDVNADGIVTRSEFMTIFRQRQSRIAGTGSRD